MIALSLIKFPKLTNAACVMGELFIILPDNTELPVPVIVELFIIPLRFNVPLFKIPALILLSPKMVNVPEFFIMFIPTSAAIIFVKLAL